MRGKGFTTIELLICTVILALFMTIVSTTAGRFDEDVKIAAALKDMKTIQTALVSGVYPDLGHIPCGVDADSTDERKAVEALFVPAYLFMERSDVQKKLEALDCLIDGYVPEYEKYESKGWRGPYMKAPNGVIDATYFDEEGFPETSGHHVYLDALLTPWADDCEEMAREAESAGDPDLALEYRKGKYYQVLYPQVTMTWPEYVHDAGHPFEFSGWNEPPYCQISRYGAQIVCRGADCLPPQAPQVDMASYIQCEAQIMEGAFLNIKTKVTTLDMLESRVQQEFMDRCHECYEDGKAVPLEKRLSIIDPENETYMDIGDDLVMSVFGQTLRSPLDN
ncbi:MAG: prepilin-type N-terminal cleavage/methylation domain-containing protein [Desulfobacteraceae bacterium]